MSIVRPLQKSELSAFASIVANAYPGWGLASEQERNSLAERMARWGGPDDPGSLVYGLFRDDELLGGMRYLDFTMNLHGARASAGGLGLVAVHLAHKKEKVARDMVRGFVRHYREQGACMAMLYPFRHDFYKAMGFGYGSPVYQYRVRPSALPKGPSKSNVRLLGKGDEEALLACYARDVDRTHGMIEKTVWEKSRLFANPATYTAGCWLDGALRGYMVFNFKQPVKDNDFVNDLHVLALHCDTHEALAELLTWLRSQADQVRRVVVSTQHEGFHLLLSDPCDGSDAHMHPDAQQVGSVGLGLMYHVVDVPGAFRVLKDRNFGGQTCRLKLTVRDTMLPENDGSTLVHFKDGMAQVVARGAHDVEVSMDVAEFSSLLMGVAPFRTLHAYSLAEIADAAWVDTVNRIFAADAKPVCTTMF